MKPNAPKLDRPEDALQQEAMAVARSIQRPGQSKETTKLIAQGIAKGIELYKKQQSAKARERDKARKRSLRLRQDHGAGGIEVSAAAEPAATLPGRAPLLASGALFGSFALIHLLRVLAGWQLVLGDWAIPASLSLAAAVLFSALSAWVFRCAFSSPSEV